MPRDESGSYIGVSMPKSIGTGVAESTKVTPGMSPRRVGHGRFVATAVCVARFGPKTVARESGVIPGCQFADDTTTG